jgi:putative acetyltransferase
MITIREDDLSHEATHALLVFHRASMVDNSPPEHAFALDLSGLQAPGITVWTAWAAPRSNRCGRIPIIYAEASPRRCCST